MRIVLRVAAVFLIVIGAIWVMQGINVLPGSFMSGQSEWAYRGSAALLVGVIILLYGSKMRKRF
jgi:hypothetical protein